MLSGQNNQVSYNNINGDIAGVTNGCPHWVIWTHYFQFIKSHRI